MKLTKIAKALAATSILTSASLSFGADLVIAADTSQGNPMMSSLEFAEQAAQSVHDHILTMEKGDTITFTTFGDGGIKHGKEISLQISRRLPETEAAKLAKAKVKTFAKSRDPEGSTHLLSFFEIRNFDCKNTGADLFVLSDAIENSETYSGDKILEGKALPKPFKQNLKGCRVTIIGAGLNGDRELPRDQRFNIETVWTDWLKLAGVSDITILTNP